MAFEILTRNDTTWQIEATVANKTEAEEVATQMLSGTGVNGVRVVLEQTLINKAIDQLEDEDIVFEKLKEIGQEKVFINDIDDAPSCAKAQDLLNTDSRKTINRLFRRYLDKNNITGMEALHNNKELKRVMDADSLVPSAIAKVVKLQVGSEQQIANDRRDILFKFIQEITEDARKAEEKQLPRINGTDFETALLALDDITQEDSDFDYLLNTVITRELIDTRDWWGKLAQCIGWATSATDPRVLPALDKFLAEILANNSVVQDLLGNQPDLGSAIIEMLDLSSGTLTMGNIEEMQTGSIEQTKAQLNLLLSSETFKECHITLADRVSQQIKGATALSKTGSEGDRERFNAILERLIIKDQVLGGKNTAQAITERQSRLLNKGGLTGLKEAVDTIVYSLQSPSRKAAFLLSLWNSKKGAEQLSDHIQEQINLIFLQSTSLGDVVDSNLPPNQKMQQVTSSFYQIEKSTIDDEQKQKILTNLDELLFSYIEESKIMTKINSPDRPVHLRALMLVGMCQPEMLPRGKASEIPRGILKDRLKQPNFNSDLVAQIDDPQEKDKIINRFQEQLKRAELIS